MRRLCLILGDQLDRDSVLFADFDATQDALWMAEVAQESTHVWSHKQRIALFLSGMRHFAVELRQRGFDLHYRTLGEHPATTLAEALRDDIARLQPAEIHLVRPGDYRVLQMIAAVCREAGVQLKLHHDRHFLSTPREFRDWAGARKSWRMEYWYRELRKRYGVLLDDGQPCGGQWNFDQDNRGAFGKHGPGPLPQSPQFESDEITRAVIETVHRHFGGHPGTLESLPWAVTPAQAETLLQRFLDQCLQQFGDYQDAMWTAQPFLYHSLLSAALNLKLLHPLHVIQAAEQRYRDGTAPLAAVEGFIRQILGWREYVRGLYWLQMPDWLEWNALQAQADLPAFYWSGETPMRCLHESITQTLQYGYAHHIQRLMVTGLFALLYGVEPRQVHEWYLAVYVDAVEWVELPNTLGMSQYADDGRMASKPYVASGKYIQRMSNYCKHCRFDPGESSGADACPFTTLYWDFLQRHEQRFAGHPRMALMLKNLQRLPVESRAAISQRAQALRQSLEETLK